MDMVNSPPHYNQGRYETIDIIEDADLGYHLSSALKYLLRCQYKDKEEEDLLKCVWYIHRHIEKNVRAPVSLSKDKDSASKVILSMSSRNALEADTEALISPDLELPEPDPAEQTKSDYRLIYQAAEKVINRNAVEARHKIYKDQEVMAELLKFDDYAKP